MLNELYLQKIEAACLRCSSQPQGGILVAGLVFKSDKLDGHKIAAET